MKKIFHLALLISFIATLLVPITGIHIHKLASVIFLFLTIAHAIVWRKKMNTQRWLLIALVVACFFTGLFGMFLKQYPFIMTTHRVFSLAAIFFLAIHIYIYRRRIRFSRT